MAGRTRRRVDLLAIGLGAFVVRCGTAGHGIVTVDEPTWMARSQNFFEAITSGRLGDASLPIGDPKTRPGVTTMWIGSVARFLTLAAHRLGLTESATTPFETSSFGLAIAQLLTAVVCSGLIVLIALLTARLLGRRVGVVTGLLLAVEPFVVAHTVVLHTDGILALTLVASALALMVALRMAVGDDPLDEPRVSWAAAGGLLAGLALLTKVSAVIYLPGLAVPIAVALARRSQRSRLTRDAARALVVTGATFLGALLVATFVLWPALWVHPVRQVQALVDSARLGESGHPTFFRGRTTDDPGWQYYLYVIPLRATPVLLIGAPLGIVLAFLRRGQRAVVATVALLPVPYLVAISLATKQFDRYSLPVLVTMAILAAVAIDHALSWLAARTPRMPEPVSVAALALGSLLVALPIFWVTPYPLAYFDPLAGGAHRAQRTLLVGWGEGLEQVGRAIRVDRRGDCEGVVTSVPAISNFVSFPCGVVIPLRARVFRNLSDITYAVNYVADQQRGTRQNYFALVHQQGTLIKTVRIQGTAYAELWRIDHPPPGACADDRMAVPIAPRCG